MSFSQSKIVRATFMGLLFAGLTGSCIPSYALSTKLKIGAAALAFAISFANSLTAIKQAKQPVITHGSLVEKIVNWYRRVICGVAGKKTHLEIKGTNIKDAYSESSGIYGTMIGWYDANEKDVKKALALGAIPAAAIMGWLTVAGIKEFVTQNMLKAPYGEVLAKV